MVDIDQLLGRYLGVTHWRVRRPSTGFRESYIAESGDRSVFVKLDVDARPLRRLAELGLAPALLATGVHDSRRFAVQELVDGTHPSVDWFSGHTRQLAKVMQSYQQDRRLAEIVGGDRRAWSVHLRTELETASSGFDQLRALGLLRVADENLFQLLTCRAEALPPVPLVPSHTDPNASNILDRPGGVMLVDWDDITLSDPLRDAGLVLWWYVPESGWGEMLAAPSAADDEPARDRVSFWAAITSLHSAIEAARLGDVDTAARFLEDFRASVTGRGNPKRNW